MPNVILYTKNEGVFLGSCLGIGFWSKVDPASQEYAVVFSSEQEAIMYVSCWDNPVEGIQFLNIHNKESGFANIEECIDAGVERWDPHYKPPVHTAKVHIVDKAPLSYSSYH